MTKLRESDLQVCKTLLQRGISLMVPQGTTIHSFLNKTLGLEVRFINEKITTVFLDGKVADNLETAILREGCVVALSASLPGVAGAALRRDGKYAALRDAITHDQGNEEQKGVGQVTFTLKVFNLLIDEIAPILLSHGWVSVSGEPYDKDQ